MLLGANLQMNFSSPVHSTAVNHFCSVFQSFVSFISSIFISNISLVCLLHIDNILTCLLGVIITFILNSYPIPSNNCAPLVWFVACLLHCTFQAYGYFGCESRLAPEQRIPGIPSSWPPFSFLQARLSLRASASRKWQPGKGNCLPSWWPTGSRVWKEQNFLLLLMEGSQTSLPPEDNQENWRNYYYTFWSCL